MNSIRYYTGESVEILKAEIADHIDWYYGLSGSAPKIDPIGGIRESRVNMSNFNDMLLSDEKKPSSTDVDNALLVYNSLEELTFHQASIERMWVYLCHCVAKEYVVARWLYRQPADEITAIRNVRNHFFASSDRALIRDNALSRLWWLGSIAHDIDPGNPREFLTILLHKQDVRSALIERPAVSRNRKVLCSIYEVMYDHWNDGKELFEREKFRSWMTALNRRGGVILLDSLPEQELDRLLREEVKRVLD